MKLWFILLILLVVIGFIIVSSYSLDLSDKSDQKTFTKAYVGYIVKAAKNIKDLTQQGFKQDWEIKNESETT